MKQITIALIGAGSRGRRYTDIAANNPEKYKVVAVAEPIENRRNYIKEKHNIPDEMCFNTWEDLLVLPRFADMVIISTMDELHFAPAMAAIEKKYDILLEKPIAPTPKECVTIAEAANKNGCRVTVCHVLRYAPFFKTLKKIIDDGKIGKIMSIDHIEAVGNIHQSHSFVRGNWKNSDETTPMIMAKSCHDLDILQWLIGEQCKSVSSFGSLTFFTKENKPKNAPERCIEGCPHSDECLYDAVKIYLKDEKNSWFRTAATKKVKPTNADVELALKTTDYGRCVYSCNNNVVDHQVVNMEFEDKTTVVFSMNAFAYKYGGRYINIFGTKGEIHASMKDNSIMLTTFADGKTEKIEVVFVKQANDTAGHGGGDEGIMVDLYDYLSGTYNGNSVADINISCANHIIGFASEQARIDRSVIDIADYSKKISNNK